MTLSRCKTYDNAYKATLLNGTLRVQFGLNDIQIKTSNADKLFTLINLYNPERDQAWANKYFTPQVLREFKGVDEFVRSMI